MEPSKRGDGLFSFHVFTSPRKAAFSTLLVPFPATPTLDSHLPKPYHSKSHSLLPSALKRSLRPSHSTGFTTISVTKQRRVTNASMHFHLRILFASSCVIFFLGKLRKKCDFASCLHNFLSHLAKCLSAPSRSRTTLKAWRGRKRPSEPVKAKLNLCSQVINCSL